MEDFGGHIVVAMECGWGGAPRPFYRLSGDDDVSKRRSLSVGQCILQIGECIGAQVSGGNQDCRGGTRSRVSQLRATSIPDGVVGMMTASATFKAASMVAGLPGGQSMIVIPVLSL